MEKYGPAGPARATPVAQAPAPTRAQPGRAELAEPVAEAAPQAQPTLLSIPSTAMVSAAGVSSDDTSNASPEKLLRLAEQQISYGMNDKAIEYLQRAAGSNEESASKQMALQKLVQFENEATQKLNGAQGKAPLDATMVCIEVMMTYKGTSAAEERAGDGQPTAAAVSAGDAADSCVDVQGITRYVQTGRLRGRSK